MKPLTIFVFGFLNDHDPMTSVTHFPNRLHDLDKQGIYHT